MDTTELLSVLGVDGVENIDQFKDKFNAKFVSREVAIKDPEIKSKVTGQITGGLTTLFKREFGLSNEEIEGKKVEEVFSLGLEKNKKVISELEVNAGKQKDEVVIELQTKAEKYKKTADEYKFQIDGLAKALEEKESNFVKEKKGWVINHNYGETYKKVSSQFADEVVSDTLKIEGFNTIVSKTFQFDLDENGALAVYDKEGGRIQNPNKLGSFLTPEEALLKVANDNKLLKMNNAGKKEPIKTATTQTQTTGTDSQQLAKRRQSFF